MYTGNPSAHLKGNLKEVYDHESHRVGNRGGGSFLRKRCSSIANGSAGGSAEQQPSISAGWPEASANIRQCVGVNFGVGAKRAGERFTGDGHGVQRRAEFANRFEK